MKTLGSAFLAALLVFLAVAPVAAHHGGRAYYGPGFVAGPVLGPLLLPLAVAATVTAGLVTAIAAPFVYPYLPPPSSVTYSTAVHGAPPAPPPSYWYYCPDARAYYPYVGACAGGWLTVVPR
jgi:hypothetical protein